MLLLRERDLAEAAKDRERERQTFSMDLNDIRSLEGEVEASHAILGTGGVDEEDRVPTTTMTSSPGWDGIRFNRDLRVGDYR